MRCISAKSYCKSNKLYIEKMTLEILKLVEPLVPAVKVCLYGKGPPRFSNCQCLEFPVQWEDL